MADLPLLTAAQLRFLRTMEKRVPNDWKVRVAPVDKGDPANLDGRLDIHPSQLPSGCAMQIYTRQSRTRGMDFSCGLIFTDRDGHKYPLVRLNGHHSIHHNRLEKTIVEAVTPHVHYVREAYLRAIHRGERVDPDGWAVRAAHGNLGQALVGLARRVNLVVADRDIFEFRNFP